MSLSCGKRFCRAELVDLLGGKSGLCYNAFLHRETVVKRVTVSDADHIPDLVPEIIRAKSERRKRLLLVFKLSVAALKRESALGVVSELSLSYHIKRLVIDHHTDLNVSFKAVFAGKYIVFNAFPLPTVPIGNMRKSRLTLRRFKTSENIKMMLFSARAAIKLGSLALHEELNNANLHDGEQEELEQKQEIMCHAEDIKQALFKTEAALTSENAGILDNLKTALSAISNIADILPEAISIKNRLDSNLIDLKDISYEVNKLQNHVDFNPSELEEINSRLDKIYELEQKYKCNSIQDLIKYHNELRSTIEKIDNYDFEVEQLKQDIKVLYDNCIKTANDISIHRKKAAQIIEGEIKKMLVKLGMPKVSFKVNVENDSLGRNGSDKVSFLFSANNNQLQNISEIASGGEISRVMLSLKAIINNYCNLPTIIFDEIDTGVSGKIAEMMAQIMLEMGNNNRQIICITHLPQIAAKGKEHFKVYKEITGDSYTSYMKHLNNDERITEIAQMLSGCDVTSAAINNAKELLNI